MRRGLTLIEVLVVSALFAGLALVLLAVYQVAVRAHAREDAQDATNRAAMLALEQVREGLRGCQVLEPNDPTAPAVGQTRFRYPRLDPNGLFQVDNRGEPVWAGLATLSSDEGGTLWLRPAEGEPRVLGRLGEGGGITFRLVEPLLLEIKLVAMRPHTDPIRRARSELTTRLALTNQP